MIWYPDENFLSIDRTLVAMIGKRNVTFYSIDFFRPVVPKTLNFLKVC
jgi:hypothetical protein